MLKGKKSAKPKKQQEQHEIVKSVRRTSILDLPHQVVSAQFLPFNNVGDINRLIQTCKHLNRACSTFFQPHNKISHQFSKKSARTLEVIVDCRAACVAISVAGKLIFTPEDGVLQVSDLVTGKITRHKVECKGHISSLTCSKNGDRVLLDCKHKHDNYSFLFDFEHNVLLPLEERCNGTISADGNTIILYQPGINNILKVFQVQTDVNNPKAISIKKVTEINTKNAIGDYAISGCGQKIAIACQNKIQIYELQEKNHSADAKQFDETRKDKNVTPAKTDFEYQLIAELPILTEYPQTDLSFLSSSSSSTSNPPLANSDHQANLKFNSIDQQLNLKFNDTGSRLAVLYRRGFQVYDVKERTVLAQAFIERCNIQPDVYPREYSFTSDGNFLMFACNASFQENCDQYKLVVWDVCANKKISSITIQNTKTYTSFFTSADFSYIGIHIVDSASCRMFVRIREHTGLFDNSLNKRAESHAQSCCIIC